MVRIKIVLAAGLVLTALAFGVVLAKKPAVLAAGNGVAPTSLIGVAKTDTAVCQTEARLPAGTSAIRIALDAVTGPRVNVEVLEGGRVVARGSRGTGWYGSTVTVALAPARATGRRVTVCFRLSLVLSYVALLGEDTPPAAAAIGDGRRMPGRIDISYLRPSRASWWSMAGAVIRHMGLGRAASGSWIVVPIVALMVAAIALGWWVALAELGGARPRRPDVAPSTPGSRAKLRTIPRAAWLCAAIACLNAFCWSLITPPFQVINEASNFAYVAYLAETGHLPSSSSRTFAPAEQVALEDLHQEQVRYSPQNHTIFAASQQRQLEHDLAAPLSRVSPNAGFATAEPPLYYAIEAIPYYLGGFGTLLDRLALMRLLSALSAGVTALFVFLFLCEALPRVRWAWAVGGLGVAFAPLLGLMSGGVDPDAQLYAVSAMLFFCLARGFRRGLTPRLGALTGAVIALGVMTKLNFLGLLPGALLGLLVLGVRARRSSRSAAYRALALALGIALAPLCVYVVANALAGRPIDGTVSNALATTSANGSLGREVAYIWQFYLPPLPGMHDYFAGLSTTRQLWIDGFVGLYGSIDTVFPAWVYSVALVPLGAGALLLGRALLSNLGALRRRAGELLVYGAIALGLMVLVGANDYFEFPGAIASYAQPRYLLPLIALYGAALALAARGAGRRWGPLLGAGIVVLLMAHDLFSQLLEISRFYG
jgi:hypothetical protein